MKLTPLDIKKQEFKKSLRGYDPVEVDAFLDMVADEFETAIREQNQLADEVLRLRTQLQDYLQVEKTLKETLVNAQENISASRQSSQREADIILREAEMKAERIIESARMKLERLKNDVILIKAQKESFARRLRHLLESQIELIHVLEMDDVGFDDEKENSPAPPEPGAGKKPEPAEQTESGPGRRKVEIPALQRNKHSPLVREATNPLARTDADAAAPDQPAPDEKQAGKDQRIPKITDQYIT